MKTIEIKLYKFEELSKEAKQNAIEDTRNSYYENNDFSEWAIDDCALLEPKEKELQKLFGKEYNFPLIKNNRKIYFDTDRNRHLDISRAMEITNSNQFLNWLGLNKRLIDKCDYFILEDTIEFSNQSHLAFTAIEEEKLSNAVDKFKNHCGGILKQIEESIDFRFTDECITDDLEANDYDFTEKGSIY